MKKKTAAPKMKLHRETLRHLDPKPLERVRGGLITYNLACEPTSKCGGTTQCTVTACGHC